MRIDKYLKNARIIKRRTVAKEACEQDRVLLNGKPAKPGSEVKAGDILTVRLGTGELRVRILDTPEHVPKDGAAALYEVLP